MGLSTTAKTFLMAAMAFGISGTAVFQFRGQDEVASTTAAAGSTSTSPNSATTVSTTVSTSEPTAMTTSVPEPSTLGVIGIAGCGFLRRQQRRRVRHAAR